MHLRRLSLGTVVVLAVLSSTSAHAQSGTSSAITGLVTDTQGAVIPGAAVLITNQATGTTFDTVTNARGDFTVPMVPPGTYTVTISLTGFKKAILKDVKLLAATPHDIKARLEVGGMEESITVEGGAPLIQARSAAVATTVQVNEINNLPVQSRNALEFLTATAGVSTPETTRNSTISGLDQSAINITIDGLSVQDNYLKSEDGYFARLSPRLDAVEEVTMTTVAASAETSGQGGAQIRFVTRGGTNEYHGSVYEYFRRDWLNANTWFNNRDLPPDPATGKAPQQKLRFDNYGFRFGGPIRIPGLFDGRNKAFFFVNYEESRTPSSITRNRIILSPSAQQGLFRYNAATGVREVNLLQLAAERGQTSTTDPTVAKLLADIRNATGQSGGVADLTDPLVQRYTIVNDTDSTVKYPTVRLDVQLTQKHRLTATAQANYLLSDPDTTNSRDPQFPGFPFHGVQDSDRWAWGGSLRSTLSRSLVNDLRFFGATGGATLFSTEISPAMFKGTTVGDQGGYGLNMNGACCGTGQALTNAHSTTATSSREASTKIATDTLSWVKGAHNFNFGIEFMQADLWIQNQTQVPTINFGIATGDPAESMFTTANFPGASTTQLNNARGLYAMLTGRVTSMTGNARLDETTDKYTYLGSSVGRVRMREVDLFAQDSWRAKPDLTLNFGLRYVLQLPVFALNNSYSTATLADVWGVSGVGNLFKPGTMTGKPPQFIRLDEGQKAYSTDWNNLAPNLGVAWRPTLDSGLLRTVFGSEPVFRGGFAIAYSRNGMGEFSEVFGANPGIQIDATRSQGNGNLGPVPLLFRNQSALYPPTFAESPVYPMTDVITQDVQMFDPELKTPYSMSWTAGIQRQLSRSMAIELRYIGSRGLQLWTGSGASGNISDFNYNEANIVENGFLNEFRMAQANLQANIRAGRGNSFAYFGPGTGTSPLPIYLAYFNGAPASQSGDASRYTGSNWSSTNFTNPLALYNPAPFTPAGTSSTTGLDGDATRRANARAAGLPANFFRVNPDLMGGAVVRGNGGGTSYQAFEVELRRRYASGIQFTGSYTLGRTYEYQRYSLRTPWVKKENGGTVGGVHHVFKLYGIWDLPFGKGRRFGGDASGFLERIIGGWTFAGNTRIHNGRMLEWGNVRLVGMTRDDFRKMYKLRFDDAGKKIYMLPQDVIDNTIKAFSVSATSLTGYGSLGAPSGRYLAPANGPDCIEPTDPNLSTFLGTQFGTNAGVGTCGTGSLMVQGPVYWTADLSLVKRISLKKGVYLDFRAELLNAFNHANFNPVATVSTNASAYEVTSAVESGRVAQLVARFTW
jgi:hypothetical protein